jgi:hypothetical protein
MHTKKFSPCVYRPRDRQKKKIDLNNLEVTGAGSAMTACTMLGALAATGIGIPVCLPMRLVELGLGCRRPALAAAVNSAFAHTGAAMGAALSAPAGSLALGLSRRGGWDASRRYLKDVPEYINDAAEEIAGSLYS